jgi:DNA-binding transcriptional LysR family regulator
MRWLAPRLPRLTAQIPDIVVNFSARSTAFDFADEPFDAAIHFGRPDWMGVTHDLLFHEDAVAVMAASFVELHSIGRPADLLHAPLLTLASRRHAWRAWFSACGVAGDAVEQGATFEHFLMLAQAAVAGTGAALIPQFLIEPELASGALVQPFPQPVPDAGSYYLVYPPDRIDSVALREFRDWIVSEAAHESDCPP